MATRYVYKVYHLIITKFHQNPLRSFGQENVAKMAAAAAKHDPDGIFQIRVPGGFKISRVNEAMKKTEL